MSSVWISQLQTLLVDSSESVPVVGQSGVH